MSTYPYGTASTGVFDIFNTNFSPSDIVRSIRDNYSPVNKTTMLNSIGYQLGLVQNFVNSSYLGRLSVPVQNAYMVSGWASSQFMALSGTLTGNYEYSSLQPDAIKVQRYNISWGTANYTITPTHFNYYIADYAGIGSGYFNYSGLYMRYTPTMGNPFSTSILNGSGSPSIARWKVEGTDTLEITNSSNPSYSGILTVSGTSLNLYADEITIGNDGISVLYYLGSLLYISGAGNVSFGTNICPFSNTQTIGDIVNIWNEGYINKVSSTYNGTVRLPKGGGYTDYNSASLYTCIGNITSPNKDNPSVFTYLDSFGGTRVAHAGVFPNAILLGSGVVSGYLWINSSGQLEFYKEGVSGWVLTGF